MTESALSGRPRPLLALVTDRHRAEWLATGPAAQPMTGRILERMRAAVAARIDLVQIREPDLLARDLFDLVRSCAEIAHGSDTLVVVNERVDVALAAGAHGVHLRASSLGAAWVRRLSPPGFVVGRSIHAGEEAAAEAEGADYFVAGTVFRSRSKGGGVPLLGLNGLAAIVGVSAVPVLAIGGVGERQAAAVAASGAAGVAGIDLFENALVADGHLGRLAERLRAAFRDVEAVAL